MATSLSPIKTPGFIFEPLLAPIVEQHVSARFALAPHSYAKAMHTEVELKCLSRTWVRVTVSILSYRQPWESVAPTSIATYNLTMRIGEGAHKAENTVGQASPGGHGVTEAVSVMSIPPLLI